MSNIFHDLITEVEKVKEKLNSDEYLKINNLIKKSYENNNDFYEVNIYYPVIINNPSSEVVEIDMENYKFISRINDFVIEEDKVMKMCIITLEHCFRDIDIEQIQTHCRLYINKKMYTRDTDLSIIVIAKKI